MKKSNNIPKFLLEAKICNDNNCELKKRIDKAVEFTEELISATKGTLNDMNYCNKEETITQYVESLEYDINHYEYLLNILRGDDNE